MGIHLAVQVDPAAVDTTTAAEGLWLGEDDLSLPQLTGPLEVDVAVLGGGIAGLLTALELKRAGATVAVLEALRVGEGVTGGTTAKATALQATILSTISSRASKDTVRAYAAANREGVELLAATVARENVECRLERRDAYTYALQKKELSSVEKEHRLAQEAGLGVEWVEEIGAPVPCFGATRLPDQIQFQPVDLVRGLARAVNGDGCSVFEGSRALKVNAGTPCTVETEHGQVQAGQVVIATHFPLLDRGLFFARLEPVRSYCIAFRPAGAAPSLPMAISAGSNSRSLRDFGDLQVIGGEGHPVASPKSTPARYEALEQFAREHWEVGEVTHRWSAQDLVPYDHRPMIGRYLPGTERLWVATGFMKWGMSNAAVGARTLARLISGAEDPYAELFSPLRVSPRSSPQVAKLGAKFSADLVLDRVKPPTARKPDAVPQGEARVIQQGAAKRGVYHDEQGRLHSVSLRCTHLGCLLRFNSAERSWDCPCHGSRFGVDGTVLEGPAARPLDHKIVD